MVIHLGNYILILFMNVFLNNYYVNKHFNQITMSKYYDFIVKRCQEVNPKLMELSMGCEVRLSSGFWEHIETFVKEDKKFWYFLWGDKFEWKNKTYEDAIVKMTVEILWHPPTLADVLLAIEWTDINFIQSNDWYWFWVYRWDWEYDNTWFIDLSLPVKEWWEEALKFLALELGYKE